ncbi:thioredoxin family protein, partial [candidate division CSSED10-310 bacterium]
MKKMFVLLVCIFTFSLSSFALASEKTKKIGNHDWLTEQNSFESIISKAQKEKKMFLMVFSATWCGPCQYVKKEIFAAESFKEVASRVILVYIEQTDPLGKKYVEKFKIRAFPTFKLFASDGTERSGS